MGLGCIIMYYVFFLTILKKCQCLKVFKYFIGSELDQFLLLSASFLQLRLKWYYILFCIILIFIYFIYFCHIVELQIKLLLLLFFFFFTALLLGTANVRGVFIDQRDHLLPVYVSRCDRLPE